jgi:hypothetical protein
MYMYMYMYEGVSNCNFTNFTLHFDRQPRQSHRLQL